ncbi:hypothetical protein ACFQ1S_07535, partial [Kibdelosporangium lantanae]
KVHVLHADQATSILVTAGPEVYVVNPADVTMARSYTASGQPEFTVTLSDAPGELLGPTATLQAFALAGACAGPVVAVSRLCNSSAGEGARTATSTPPKIQPCFPWARPSADATARPCSTMRCRV